MKYKVITVTNDRTDPEFANDAKLYPYLVKHVVEDEMEIFVIEDSKDPNFWFANDFFAMTDITEFEVIS